MWTFLEFFFCANKFYVFSAGATLIFPKLCMVNYALLCDSSLLIMSATDEN